MFGNGKKWLNQAGLFVFLLLCFLSGGIWVYAQSSSQPNVIVDAKSKAVYYPKLSDALKNETPINGVDPRKYDGFWEKWHFVVARFRPDIGELRYVYANDLAWKTFTTGKYPFPPGAILAKLAFKATEDKLFPDSEIPSRSVRVQFMVKHANSYKKSGGWAFAIYPRDLIEVRSDALENQVCFACHQIPKSRDFTFSLPFLRDTRIAETREKDFHQYFTDVKVSTLPANVQNALSLGGILPSDTVKGWKTALFSGSLSEVRRPLTGYASEDKTAYALYDLESGDYFVALPLESTATCESMVMTLTKVYPEGYWEGKSTQMVEDSEIIMCNGKVLSSKDFTKGNN